MLTSLDQTRSIVFDLDGTLYISKGIADGIQRIADKLLAQVRGVSLQEARKLLQKARQRLAELHEAEPTLTRTCMELGIDIVEFHEALQKGLSPERHLNHDPVLFALLDSLRDRCNLYVYTNNNLPLTRKIVALLGVENLFDRLYTIEFTWTPKPDAEALRRVIEDIGGLPETFLFVGDRKQVDLYPAESVGIPTLLVSETSDLLQIHKMLGIIP